MPPPRLRHCPEPPALREGDEAPRRETKTGGIDVNFLKTIPSVLFFPFIHSGYWPLSGVTGIGSKLSAGS
jgi:hypothetical protein